MNITIRKIVGGYVVIDNTNIEDSRYFANSKELADYINPPAAKPEIEATDFLREESAKAQSAYKCTAPPFPSNHANLQNMVSNINCANTPFMNAQMNCGAYTASILNNNASQQGSVIGGVQQHDKQSIATSITKTQFDNYKPVREGAQEAKAKEADKPKQSADDRLRVFFSQAQAQGYQGRVLDYISALIAAKKYLNAQDADNSQDSDSDLPELVRARRSGDTVKVSINDLQDDGK